MGLLPERPPIPPGFDDIQAIALETLWLQMESPNYPLSQASAESYMEVLGAYFISKEVESV